MNTKAKTRLILKKETITLLNDDQLMTLFGGYGDQGTNTMSCDHDSCNSIHNEASCAAASCDCSDNGMLR
jgi:hypothetical protein